MMAIDAYLNSPPPGYALLIAGAWGSGKSFTWTQLSNAMDEPKPITFSAAGLKTYADLERALFQASISGIGESPFGEAGAVLGRALLRFAKIEPDEIKLKASVCSGKTVICIDDVERFSGKFEVLFGFVVNILDKDNLHCVLIADENRANSKFEEFGKYKERIVGKTIFVNPDIRKFCEVTIAGLASERSREQLSSGIERIVALVEAMGLRNLRTVRFLLTELDGVIQNLPAIAKEPITSSSLLPAMAFWISAAARNSRNLNVLVSAFAHDDLGMALAFHKMNREKRSAETDTLIGSLYELLEDMRLIDEAHSWPRSPAFISMMRGDADTEYAEIASDFGLMTPEADLPKEPLSILNDYRNYSDHEIQEAILAGRQIILSGTPANLNRDFSIFRALYFLSKIGIYDIEPTSFVQEVRERLQQLLATPQLVEGESLYFWPDSYDENEKTIIGVIEEIEKAVISMRKILMRRDFMDALIDDEEPPYDGSSEPIFDNDADPDRLVDRIRSGGMGAVIRLRRVIGKRLRITNAGQFVGEDKDFALRLAGAIDKKIPFKRPMTALDAELRGASEALSQFAKHVTDDGVG